MQESGKQTYRRRETLVNCIMVSDTLLVLGVYSMRQV